MKSSNCRPSRVARNPFVHELRCTLPQTIKIGLMSLTVFPVRLLLVASLMLLAWPFAFVASLGRSEFVMEPPSWWMSVIDLCLRVIMRAMWFCGGFHWIKVKGERAPPTEVPILTLAPHSSYFDAIPVTMTMCSIVGKLESRSIPVWGRLQEENGGGDQAESPVRRGVASDHDIPGGDVHQPVGAHLVQAWSFHSRTPGAARGAALPEHAGYCFMDVARSRRLQDPVAHSVPASQPPGDRVPPCLHSIQRGEGEPCAVCQQRPKAHGQVSCFVSLLTRRAARMSSPTSRPSALIRALQLPLTDLTFEDREITLSQGPLRIHDYSGLLEFHQLVCRLRPRAGRTDEALEEQARRARKLQGDGLSAEDLAQFLDLPLTDALAQVHSLFDPRGDGLMDVRLFVIALSTVQRPSETMETLKLAFEMYEDEETGDVQQRDLAAIFEIMLGVKKVELSSLFSSLEGPHRATLTYDELCHFIEHHPTFVEDYLTFENHPRPRAKSCNGRHKDD
ncbi:lysophosphatidylcholine acyltransferase 1 isoform 3-T3 [Spinachia spinachia]